MINQRKNITQPADWWAVFEAEAARQGMPLSQWIGIAAVNMLTEERRKTLSQRAKPGRKKSKG